MSGAGEAPAKRLYPDEDQEVLDGHRHPRQGRWALPEPGRPGGDGADGGPSTS